MSRRRFHPVFFVRYFKYALVLCLVPLLNALLRWDIATLHTAFWQDAGILALVLFIAAILWRHSGVFIHEGIIAVYHGFFVRQELDFRCDSVSAVVVRRPLWHRVLQASSVDLYFKENFAPRKYTLYLSREDAVAVAQLLAPCTDADGEFSPAGTDRAAFIALSANMATSVMYAYLSLRQMEKVFGSDWRKDAISQLNGVEDFLQQYLPSGLALLTTLAFVICTLVFAYAFGRCVGFRMRRCGNVLLVQGGLFTKVERRILVDAITAYEVRMTPIARLLHRYPIYIRAGGYAPTDAPLLAYKRGGETAVASLLPGFTMPEKNLCNAKDKSIAHYFWLPGIVFVFLLLVYLAAITRLPAILPMLFPPFLLCAYALVTTARGLHAEGMGRNRNGVMNMVVTGAFSLSYVCLPTRDVSLRVTSSPFMREAGMCDVYFCLPCHRYRVRSVPFAKVRFLHFNTEKRRILS